MAEKVYKFLNDNPVARWSALLLLALAMFCSYIFMDILSPIKDLMQETRGWDSTAFGTMQGSEVFLNVFVFFLIFAGIILDKMGVRFTAVLSAAVLLARAWAAASLMPPHTDNMRALRRTEAVLLLFSWTAALVTAFWTRDEDCALPIPIVTSFVLTVVGVMALFQPADVPRVAAARAPRSFPGRLFTFPFISTASALRAGSL
jgi:hypothetical protein